MMGILRDLRNGLRLLVRHPGLVIFASLAIGLGVGAPTTMFSIIRGLLRDLPFEDGDRIVYLLQSDPGAGLRDAGLTGAELQEFHDAQTTLQAMAGFSITGFSLAGGDGWAERVDGVRMNAAAFDLLRVRPLLGSRFGPEHELPTAESVALISESLWRDRFGGNPAVLGRVVRLNRRPATIVGIMPASFRFPFNQDIWVPLQRPAPGMEQVRDLQAFGRLRDGVTIENAAAEFAALGTRIRADQPSERRLQTTVVGFKDSQIEPSDRLLFGAMLGVVTLVLLVACANVANLLLVRAVARTQSASVKRALGASRGVMIREVLAESAAIALLGGVVGIALAWLGVAAFTRAVQPDIPNFWMVFRVDPVVLTFSMVLTTTAVFLAGVVPALQTSRVDPGTMLRDQTRGSSGLRLGRATRMLVVAELAMSCALLMVAGLMIKGVRQQTAGALAFSPENILSVQLEPVPMDSGSSVPSWSSLVSRIVQRLSEDPRVVVAAVATSPPGFPGAPARVALAGQQGSRPEDFPDTRVNVVAGDFFALTGTSAVSGRLLDERDGSETLPVAVVSQRFASRHFPSGGALGSRLRLHGIGDSTSATIVGVVPDLGTIRRDAEADEVVYLPLAQRASSARMLLIRTRGPSAEVAGWLRQQVAAVDPDVPISQIVTLGRHLGDSRRIARVFATLFTGFGLAGLLLAVIGLYGVVLFSVKQRTRDIAIRNALGATPARLMASEIQRTLWQIMAGLLLGSGLTAVVAPLLEGLLFGARPHDPAVYGLVATVLAGVAVLAALRPALWASRVPPAEALRS